MAQSELAMRIGGVSRQ